MVEINEIMVGQIQDRLVECGIHRILECVEKLTEDQLYYRPNANSNSINNLVIHLDGNVRQWLIASMSEEKDNRNRPQEFDENNAKSKEELKEILVALEQDIIKIYPLIKKIDLTAIQEVQCYTESNLSIITHVIEHFSYHVGQITYITKMVLDIDTGYYSGKNLEKTN